MKKKKLLINVSSIIPLYLNGYLEGIGRSTYELLIALQNYDSSIFDIEIFSQNTHGLKVKDLQKYAYHHFYIPNRPFFNSITNFLKLKCLLFKYDIYHIPHNTECVEKLSHTLFTIHDLIVYRYPEMWGLTDREREQHKKIAKGCLHIVTCSEASKKDIMKFWNVPENKITAIHWGVNRNKFRPVFNEQILIKYHIKTDYFLCVSCNHPRKNLSLLLSAYKQYVNKGGAFQLVLVSPMRSELQPYSNLIDSNRIIVCRGINDEDLITLYSHAHASIMISLYEGFGFPILESLACNTQVICAKNSSLQEVGGTIVSYLKHLTVNDLCSKLENFELLNKSSLLDNKALEIHLKNFSWDICARQYLQLYESLMLKIS